MVTYKHVFFYFSDIQVHSFGCIKIAKRNRIITDKSAYMEIKESSSVIQIEVLPVHNILSMH